MTEYDERFYPFQRIMRERGIPELFIETFAAYYHQLLQGNAGLIYEDEIEPVESLVHMFDIPADKHSLGKNALSSTAVIKLNGGLGTSMGLQQAKSLLIVKDGYTFLDIIAEQAAQSQVPLILMNSFATDADTREALSRHTDLKRDVSQTFLQHMELKVCQHDFSPVETPQNPELAWCPPGHGDIYIALVTQGVLEELLAAGYRYAFVSNADNLGATLDLSLLGYFVEKELPFMMEVTERTDSDRKGGHLARRRESGRLLLRELAQCPESDLDTFQNIDLHCFFNTNNLWLDLEALDATLQRLDYKLILPMIRNAKTLDPRDRESAPVFQLETAMGSAIEMIERSEAIAVPRSRFAPVKKTSDLLVVRSDVYSLQDDFSVQMSELRNGKVPVVELDPQYYQFVQDFDQRFAHGVPSLIACDSLSIVGDVGFGARVTIEGNVLLVNDTNAGQFVPDATVLTGD